MDVAKVIDKLNDILRWEWTGVHQYSQFAFLVSGPWREVYAGFFRGEAKESFGHARLIGEKIVALGGIPTVERANVRQSADLLEMLQIGLEFESAAVKLYTECLDMANDDVALRVMLEDQVLQEQTSVDEFTKLLRDQAAFAATLKTSSAKVG
jgi:bacterioferritin